MRSRATVGFRVRVPDIGVSNFFSITSGGRNFYFTWDMIQTILPMMNVMKMTMMSMRKVLGETAFWDSCLGMSTTLVISMLITLMRMRRSILLHWQANLVNP